MACRKQKMVIGPVRRCGRYFYRYGVGLVASAALLGTGCATWEPAARENFAQEAGSTSSLRPPGPLGQQLGLDPRAREIERNLGVR